MIVVPRRRWMAAVGLGTAAMAAIPDVRYVRRLQGVSRELRLQLAEEMADLESSRSDLTSSTRSPRQRHVEPS